MKVHDAGLPYVLQRTTPYWWTRDLILLDEFIPDYPFYAWGSAWKLCRHYIKVRNARKEPRRGSRAWQLREPSWSFRDGAEWLKSECPPWNYPWGYSRKPPLDPPECPP
jgi:hypothetical protein